MKKRFVGLLAAVVVMASIPSAHATGWGVGAFGGVSVPIAQDDGEQGSVFGARLKLSLGGVVKLGLEPNVTFFKNGDWEIGNTPGETIEGSKFQSLGVNLLLGGTGAMSTPVRFFSFVGAKYYTESTDLRDTDGRTGLSAGMGVEFGAGNIGIEGRGSFELMTLDGGGSRKWGHITVGMNLYFGTP